LIFESVNQIKRPKLSFNLFGDFHLIARSGKSSRRYQFDCVCAARL